jgi:hypothetical protein
VDIQLPQEALDAEPGDALPAGLNMQVSTNGNANVLQVRHLHAGHAARRWPCCCCYIQGSQVAKCDT